MLIIVIVVAVAVLAVEALMIVVLIIVVVVAAEVVAVELVVADEYENHFHTNDPPKTNITYNMYRSWKSKEMQKGRQHVI